MDRVSVEEFKNKMMVRFADHTNTKPFYSLEPLFNTIGKELLINFRLFNIILTNFTKYLN